MMEKNLISKSIYLSKVSEFCESNKKALTKDEIETLLIWTCNNSIFKNPKVSSYSQSYYTKEQLNTISKNVLITFSKTINELKQLSSCNENLTNTILKPINDVLEK